jgi:signal transduction histidine kinase
LIDNAHKYTNSSGSVIITLRKEKRNAVFRISNSGSGISKADLPRIFDRFYRPDSSRSSDTGGTGLGLAIAKSIIEQAGGKITAESEAGLTTFTITLKAT